MPVVLHRAVSLIAAIALGSSLAACGGAEDPATPGTSTSPKAEAKKKPTSGALYKQTRESALGSKSGHITGSMTEDGEKTALDMAGTVDGSNQQATFTTSDGEFTLLTVGGKNWIKGDAKYWTSSAGADAAKAIGAKWLAVPASEAKDMGDTNLKGLLTEIFAEEGMSKLESLTTEVAESTESGVATYVLTDKVGDTGELVVTADGKAQLIKISGPKSDPGELAFSEWDAVKPFVAPAATQVFTP